MQQADQETQISSPHSETLSFNCVILIETSSPNPPAPPPKKCKPSFQAGSLSFCSQPGAILPRACRYFGHVVKFNKPSGTGDKNFMFTERLEAARMSIKLSPTEVWYREVPYSGQARFLQTLKIFLT